MDKTGAVAVPRTSMYVPGQRARMIEKALTSEADRLIFDLEDSVPLEEKESARRLVAGAIPNVRDKQVFVRVNGITTAMTAADLEAIVQPGLDGIVLPKSESSDVVKIASYLLSMSEKRMGLPEGTIRILVSLETAVAIANCRSVLTASPRVSAASCGVSEDGDLQKDLGYTWSPEGIERFYAMGRVILEGRAAGVCDFQCGGYVRYNDDAGLERAARLARQFGYTSMAAFHPRQLPILNRAFSYSDEEVAYYRRVVDAMEDAYKHGLAAVTVDGRMVDVAMLKRAQSVVALAHARQTEPRSTEGSTGS